MQRRPRLRTLLIAAAAVVLLAGSAAYGLASRVEPVKSLAVHDANGRLIGQVVETSNTAGHAIVVVRMGSRPVALYVSRTQFEDIQVGGTYPGRLVFASEDCTGQPFVEAFTDPNELFPAVVKNGTKVYSAGPIESRELLHVRSVLETDGLCSQLEFDNEVSRTEQIGDLATFRPPFSLRMK